MNRLIGSAVLLLALATLAQAHFVFIVPPAKDGEKVQVVFSDSTKPDKAEYLKKIAHTKFQTVDDKGEATQTKATANDKVLQIEHPGKGVTCVVGTTPYGVLEKKKDEPFLLIYYSRAALSAGGEKQKLPAKVAPLQAVITECKDSVTVLVLWQGKPIADAEVALATDEEDAPEAVKTDKNGEAKIVLPKKAGPLLAVRARHIEQKEGESDGKKYNSVRYYTTTVFKKP